MNTPIIDVAIGLIFIYLLYSLLTTSTTEIIGMVFDFRSRMLEKAIERMLDGKSYGYSWYHKIINGLLWIYYSIISFPNKRLHDDSLKRKIDSTSFFKSKSINTISPDQYKEESQKSKTYVKRIILNKKASLFAARVINHPLYRRSAEDSLFSKKPSYLAPSTYADILYDVLGYKRSEKNSAPVLMSDIKTFVNQELADNPELKNILNIYIEQANGDVAKFKLLLETWYNETMDRVSGWYKRLASQYSIYIGLLLAISFNVDTIEIAKRLANNRDLSEAVVKSADAFRNENPDSAKVSNENLKIGLDSLNILMGLGWNYDIALLKKQWLLVPKSLNTEFNKAVFIAKKTTESPRRFIGFLITAFAISLGAPFWFDLLNKFLNIRGSGVKPKEDSKANSNGGTSKNSVANSKPATNSFG